MADSARVILVEDDPTVRRLVGAYLDGHGYETISCATGVEGRTAFRDAAPDLLIVDRMLPGLSGDELCREVRADSSVPIIMLTALRDEEHRIEGLELGVDDYLGKPFSMKELLLRVEAVLRRTRPHPATQRFTVGRFTVDPTRRRVWIAGREVTLTAREYELLVFLLHNPRVVLSRDQILAGVWEWSFGDGSTVTVHVRRLREKIEPDPTDPIHLRTQWGAGYVFDPEPAS